MEWTRGVHPPMTCGHRVRGLSSRIVVCDFSSPQNPILLAFSTSVGENNYQLFSPANAVAFEKLLATLVPRNPLQKKKHCEWRIKLAEKSQNPSPIHGRGELCSPAGDRRSPLRIKMLRCKQISRRLRLDFRDTAGASPCPTKKLLLRVLVSPFCLKR